MNDTLDLGHAQDWARITRETTDAGRAHILHDLAFGRFLSDHDGQQITVVYEQHGVEVEVRGVLRLTYDAAYWIGDRRLSPTPDVGRDDPEFEGYPVRWTTLA